MPKQSRKRKGQDVQSTSEVKKQTVEKPSTSTTETTEKVVQFSGTVPVDEGFPEYATGPYHVYTEQKTVYNAMLNQTNIGENNNKYYLIQIVKHDKKNEYVNLCRWGRVGKVAGQSENVNDLANAKQEFMKKFRDKTGNYWPNLDRVGLPFSPFFKKVKGKYDLVKIDYGGEKVEEEIKKLNETVESKLPKEVQDVIRLIFDKREWEASVKEMKFDIKKAPLGKLTAAQIKAGYESLKKIEECLKPGKSEQDLTDACSEFYTRIPHDFGMKRPPLIRTAEEIKEKLDLMDALNDIQIAVTLMDDEKEKKGINTLDYYYNSLQCDMQPLDKKNAEFKMIAKYIKNTHGNLHKRFKLQIEDIFQVQREKDSKRFKKNIGNRMLLWHGSRLTNWCGILKEGLRIAPPEAPVSGYMFGKGVYFADIVSKSAQYCWANFRQPTGFLLLCEVALGGMNEKINSDYNASKLPKGKHSTKGMGRQEPAVKQNHTFLDGITVPLGKLQNTKVKDGWLRYNEYIVYDVAQINPRYLVKLKFDWSAW